jgi:Predicted methyltransferase regulatory domain
MPGWAAAAPLQRLVMEHAGLHPNARDVQVQEARTFVDRMIDAKAEYFNANATPGSILQNRLDSWRTDKPMYLAHEYMNRCWQALYHADVARDLAAAKLDYVGSADYCHAFPKLCLTPQQRELLATVPDPAWRETVKDYLQNTGFRSDVFVRGARRMTAPRRMEWMQQIGLALTVPRVAATMGMTPETMTGQDDLKSSLLDALAKGPRTLAELASLHGQDIDLVSQSVALLGTHDQGAAYFLCSAGQDPEPAQRLNRAIAQQSRLDDRYQAVASPLLGNGMGAGLIQRLVYLSLQQTDRIDALAIARQAWKMMKDQGEPIVLADQPLAAGDEALVEILRTVKLILELRLPIWRQTKIL